MTGSTAPVNWTGAREWGTEGLTHTARVSLPDGAEFKFVVDQPFKGEWVARGWQYVVGLGGLGEFVFYRNARTLKEAKALVQAFVDAGGRHCETCGYTAGTHAAICTATPRSETPEAPAERPEPLSWKAGTDAAGLPLSTARADGWLFTAFRVSLTEWSVDGTGPEGQFWHFDGTSSQDVKRAAQTRVNRYRADG